MLQSADYYSWGSRERRRWAMLWRDGRAVEGTKEIEGFPGRWRSGWSRWREGKSED